METQKLFEQHKEKTIALYGLGTETQRVLNEIGEHVRIAGLLDGFRTEGMLYGKKIINLSECIREKVELIIVVARPGSCRAITNRIGGFCRENKIALIDIRGKNLLESSHAVYYFQRNTEITREQLMAGIEENDIVSFDLFDTLIMRKVLYPADVIELVDCRLKESGIYIEDFCGKRLQAEKELSRNFAPTLGEIYECVLRGEDGKIKPHELADMEWETDRSLLIARQDMVNMAAEAWKVGKKVYIVTDSYYKKEQLKEILDEIGLTGYTDMLVSCEWKTGKTQDLFQRLKETAQGKTYLHIGDDAAADIASAKRQGIHGVQICNTLELLEKLGWLGMEDRLDSLASRIKLGMFAASLLNSPFQFEMAESGLRIGNAYQIGYLCIAPMITDFMFWFDEQMKTGNYKNIWLGARDGYLIQKLYHILDAENDAVYFLTSRMAALRAGIENAQDIAYVAEMKYQGSLQEQLAERFGLDVPEEEISGKKLSDFSGRIMENARCRRENYQSYIQKLLKPKEKIAFFDFVAKGTTQLYISRLVEEPVTGYYFLQLEKEYMADKGLDIVAFCDEEDSAIYEDYYILEPVVTSPEASVVEFGEDGTPIYARETRTSKDIACCMEIQQGIMDYFRSFISLCPAAERKIDREMDEMLLSLIHKMKIDCKDFLNLNVEDPFFGRMTSMKDLL